MSDVSKNMALSSCTIVDSPRVFGRLIYTVLVLIAGCWVLLLGLISAEPAIAIFFGCMFMAFSALSFIRFIVIAQGFVINVENNIFEFPGGGIAAESWTSYFTSAYWLQEFKRHQVPLSKIRLVDSQVRPSIISDVLDISGDFGAIRFKFFSKGKKDQLYSAIIQLNAMGSPVLRR